MTPFSISALHILSECDIVLRKNLKEEWYFFNSRVKKRGKFLEVVPEEKIKEEFYGKNISISAIVGTNGSGKSSVLELIYRIINNLSAILERGKRRRAAETLYFIDGLYAELYYVINGQLCSISCYDREIILRLATGKVVHLKAYQSCVDDATEVMMKDFISYTWDSLFYTIVTNYSMQAFLAQDYKQEKVRILANNRDKQPKEDACWLNGLFHKNDGYMTPLVLNPFRDNGMIDMTTEHRLSIYRLSSCFIHARNTHKPFLKDYELHNIWYEYDNLFVTDKIVRETKLIETELWNYKPEEVPRRYIDVILSEYGYGLLDLDWNNESYKRAALYLAYKTLTIASRYPAYNEYHEYGNPNNLFLTTSKKEKDYLVKLVITIRDKDKSHISLKVRQVLHFLEACKKRVFPDLTSQIIKFGIDDYISLVGGDKNSKSMSIIQEYLPPSFFRCNIELDHYSNGERDNEIPIPISRMSAGERQYLYTFSTFIYHTLNLLSIQATSSVRYRRINLVLDEVEICFHPEYQRRFINDLVGYIKRLKMNVHASFNIIIATHSPFILSDLPESDILYLKEGRTAKKQENFKNPFCANICDILYQSFFLKDGFIGEYSRRRLRKIFSMLRTNKKLSQRYLKEVDFFMREIGDPFIIMQMKQYLKLKEINYDEKASDRR